MARPNASEAGEFIYSELEAFAVEDESTDWTLLKFVDAIMGGSFNDLLQVVSDRPDMPGWAMAFHPDLTPAAWLPWLAQVNGTRLAPSLTEAEQRAAIRTPAGFRRGTPAALYTAVATRLTGDDPHVLITERYGSPYNVLIRTLDSETPNEDDVREAILTQKPARLTYDYDTIPGQTWDELMASYATWDLVEAEYGTWAEVIQDVP